MGGSFEIPLGNYYRTVTLDFWWERLAELTRFVREHGHAKVPGNGLHRQLANWVGNVRARKERLSVEQRRELDRLGFV